MQPAEGVCRARPRKKITAGLVVGEGTGRELADIFERAIADLGRAAGVCVELVRARRQYRTYGTMTAAGFDWRRVERETLRDAHAYASFLRRLSRRGCSVAFRTAINAQTLYLVRERLWAVKVEVLPRPDGEMLVVRDATQGFYAGRNDRRGRLEAIARTCEFRRDKLHAVVSFAVEEAARRWGGRDHIDHAILAYKFHLLDRRFAAWADEAGALLGLTLQVFQPDTTNRHLLRGAFPGNLLIVAANEWADVMHVDLLARHGLGGQEERASRSVYLHPSISRFTEYQTVHGSADDMAGCGLVNPSATLRAAAALLEDAGCVGVAVRMEDALRSAARAKLTTPDVGGRATTQEVVDGVLECCTLGALTSGTVPNAARESCLLLIDLQNDFCSADGQMARLGLVDPSCAAAAADRAVYLAAAARRAGVPVVFVTTVYDERRLPEVVRERNRSCGRENWLAPGSFGADFFGPRPVSGDATLTKAGYDAFLGTDLATRLRSYGAREVVLAGLFADVCVDAAARTAYQFGFHVTVAADATLALERDLAGCLDFMRRFYYARVATVAEIGHAWGTRHAFSPEQDTPSGGEPAVDVDAGA